MALTSSVFRTACQSRLFRFVSTQPSSEKFSEQCKALSLPHIRCHVRNVRVNATSMLPNCKVQFGQVSDEVALQLGGYARLGSVYLTSALPKTRTGKIMRRLLRDVVEHGAPQGDTSAMEDVAGLQAVQQAVQQSGNAAGSA